MNKPALLFPPSWIILVLLGACNNPQQATPTHSADGTTKEARNPLERTADTWAEQGNLDSALYFLEQNYAEAQQSRDQLRIAGALKSMLEIKMQKHAYTEAVALI
ncbi:MAG: hypothetical protein ACR2K1_14365, partial [Saprospiraceae bacterium]